MTITYGDPAVNRSPVDGVYLSPQLLEANQRLHELRAKQAQHATDVGEVESVAPCSKRDVVSDRAEIVISPPPLLQAECYPQLFHSSEPLRESCETIDLEAANRRLQAEQMAYAEAQKSPIRQYGTDIFTPLIEAIHSVKQEDDKIGIDIVLLHPSIAVALLQMDRAAVGRLWLLARSLDPNGSGHINIDHLRKKFTSKKSKYRVCGWRRMRMLLAQGEGIFWERDDEGRLWVYGVGRVAALLSLEKVEGVAVHVDVKTLLNIQSCRAQFYASWFSGRKTINPISRAKLTELTGIAEEQQRLYEQIAKVDVKPCLAIGERYSLEGMQEANYQRGAVQGHGRGVVFEFIDHKGKQGKVGEKYVAWHLPNQYTGRHKRAGKSSRRNINRYLKRKNILEKKLALGNVDSVDTSDDELVVPVFFPHMKAAEQRRKKVRTAKEVYWEGTKNRSAQLWHVVLQGG